MSKRRAQAKPAMKDGTPISGRSIVPLTKSINIKRRAENITSFRVSI
ncbi:MAG: hypothetical protein ABC559_02920 [Candidatus Methanosuratincola petrocarbonis]